MAVFAKAIKPQRLKAARPRIMFLNAMRSVGKEIKKDFEKTVETWAKKPRFEILISMTGPGPVVLVDTSDEIYGYVSRGTEGPYLIEPVHKKMLAFTSIYVAKTEPRVIGSRAGGASGTTVLAPFVIHPGITAREFDVVIQKKWEPKFRRRMEKVLSEWRRVSGHAI